MKTKGSHRNDVGWDIPSVVIYLLHSGTMATVGPFPTYGEAWDWAYAEFEAQDKDWTIRRLIKPWELKEELDGE